MTGRLSRVWALLDAVNVPCELKRRPDGRPVLAAGTPTSDKWDVLVWEADGELWVQHSGTIDRLPANHADPTVSDAEVADAIKYLVVRCWADQGDAAAKALLSAIGDRYAATASNGAAAPNGPGRARVHPATGSARPAMRNVTAQFSPWGFGLRVTNSAAGDGIPTSWAWQWGLGPHAMADYYQRYFTELRNSLLRAAGNDNL